MMSPVSLRCGLYTSSLYLWMTLWQALSNLPVRPGRGKRSVLGLLIMMELSIAVTKICSSHSLKALF